MLVSLTVKEFALIKSVHLELDAGMTVFTGETGAGKSMLVDALGAVFGARASADWVRHGAGRAEIIAVWAGENDRLQQLLNEQDIESDDDLILRRIITRDGRSRAYINGVPVALKALQKVGEICLDLHGQHEHQALLQPNFQCALLDAKVADKTKADVQAAFDRWRQARLRLQDLQGERDDTAQQAAWMRDELGRLQSLEIEPHLAELLQQQVEAGRHHARIQQAAAGALALLDEAEPCARGLIARAGREAASAEAYHGGLRASREMLDQIDALLSEVTPQLRTALDSQFNEVELCAAEERLMRLHESMRRHNTDEPGLLRLIDAWAERLAALDSAAWDEANLLKAEAQARRDYLGVARTLSEERRSCAKALSRSLRPLLDRLALAGMQVRFEVEALAEESRWSARGKDAVRIRIMSNPGEPWRDISAVASGGELSRLVLALKGCGALPRMPHIAVFDEVDAGIGGETAWRVGELLAAMATERQVLVISHLPQVAACADAQAVICKDEQEGRTVTCLDMVAGDARQMEIARMLGGAGEQGLSHASTFLQRGGKAGGRG
jgi:DNA repair protein RecN (Recombination protein N)